MNEDKPSLEDLAHFGVLGMKWGHRKETSLSTEERTLQKGYQLQNISAGRATQIGDRRVFTSHTVKDNLAYKNIYAQNLKLMSKNADTYTNTLVTKKNIKIASEKTASDAFKKLYESDPVGITKAVAESQESLVRMMFFMGEAKDQKVVDQHFKTFSKKGEKWMETKGYGLFLAASGADLINRDLPNKYYTSLSKQGYDAIVDDTDKKGKLSDDPLVFLKPNATLKLSGTVPLTDADIKLAGKKYKEEKKKAKRKTD